MPEFLGRPELVILLVVVLLLFGAKRLPDSARSLGRSLRIFKAETKGLKSDDDKKTQTAPGVPVEHVVPPPSLPPAAPVAPAAPVQQQAEQSNP
jgi:sec-independent protein translocase protein TatA